MTAEDLAEVLKAANMYRPQVTNNFNAPIGQHIDYVEKLEAHFDKDMGMQIVDTAEPKTAGVMPDVFKTNRAKGAFEPLVTGGYLTEDYRPTDGVKEWELALIAQKVAEVLEIKNVWRVFGDYWGKRPDTLRTYYNNKTYTEDKKNFEKKLLNKIR